MAHSLAKSRKRNNFLTAPSAYAHTYAHTVHTRTYTRMYAYMNSVSGLSSKCSGKVLTRIVCLEWRKRYTVHFIFYNIVCFAMSESPL